MNRPETVMNEAEPTQTDLNNIETYKMKKKEISIPRYSEIFRDIRDV